MTFTKGSRDQSRTASGRLGHAYRGLAPLERGRGGFGSSLGRRRSVGARLRGLTRQALARKSPLRHMDWILLAAVLALSLIGTLLVWSATQSRADPRAYLMKQLLNIALGLALLGVVSFLDYRQLALYAPFVYLASGIGLLVLPTPLGSIVNGAHSWISL